MAEKKEVLSFQENENSPNLFFIPYDSDRFLQFGFQEQGEFKFQQLNHTWSSAPKKCIGRTLYNRYTT